MIIKKSIKKIINILSKRKRVARLEKLIEGGLPITLRPILMYLITGEMDNRAKVVRCEVEARRKAIASEGNRRIPILYSPKPGKAGDAVLEGMRPDPGKVQEFTMEKVARTGKDGKWGTALYLLVREFKCEHGVELGSCAGISALYMSSTPTLKSLTTVEGSFELSKIAETSLKHRPEVSVLNMLFNDAIDNVISKKSELNDFVFIDGHHEKVATIHYFNRLIPYLKRGALVIFDDISWSFDMREAWTSLSGRSEFSHTFDLGAIGVCIMNQGGNDLGSPMKWDLRPILGGYKIGNPAGWKE